MKNFFTVFSRNYMKFLKVSKLLLLILIFFSLFLFFCIHNLLNIFGYFRRRQCTQKFKREQKSSQAFTSYLSLALVY